MEATIIYFGAILFVVYFCEVQSLGQAGPVGKLDVIQIVECPEKLDNELANQVKVTYDLRTVGEGGKKALFATFDEPFDLDDSLSFVLIAKKWADGGWNEKAYRYVGKKFPAEIEKHIPKVFNKLRKAATPEIPPGFPVKGGNYTITNFQAETSDIGIPAILYGRFMLHFTISKGPTPIFCIQAEMKSEPKSFL